MKINQRQMEKMMRQMGMSQEPIEAEEVIIKKPDGTQIIVANPDVQKIKMMGQETFQISGTIEERAAEKFSSEDIEMIVAQTGASEDEAKSALEETGDIAEAILKLKKID